MKLASLACLWDFLEIFASLSYYAEFTGIFVVSGSVQYWQYPKQFDNFLAVP